MNKTQSAILNEIADLADQFEQCADMIDNLIMETPQTHQFPPHDGSKTLVISSEMLGQGASSYVYKGTYGDTPVAVKRAKSAAYTTMLRDEIKLHKKCKNNDYIVSFLSGNNVPELVLEFVRGGDLYTRTHNADDTHPFTADDYLKVFRGVAKGLVYLHSINIIHRDIKPENIFLTQNDEPKIGDFGLACLADEEGRGTNNKLVGTPLYIPAEVLKNQHIYSYKSDVFSFGIMALTIASNQPPYHSTKNLKRDRFFQALYNNRLQLNMPRDINPAIQSLVVSCATFFAKNRPNTAELSKKVEALDLSEGLMITAKN